MKFQITSLITILFALLLDSCIAATHNDTADSYGCDITTSYTSVGFNVVFHPFGVLDTEDSTSDLYMTYGYKSTAITNRTAGVTDPQLGLFGPTENYTPGYVYNTWIPSATNFLMELTGYFKAAESGVYTFGMNADDGWYVFFGDASAFECCVSTYGSNVTDGYLIKMGINDYRITQSAKIYLKKGFYYPIRIVYLNYNGRGLFNFTLITPSGTTIKDDWSDYIFQFPDQSVEGSCPATTVHEFTTTTTTLPWTGTQTTSTTISELGGTYLVEIETPASTVDTTSTWTGSTPSDTIFTSNGTPYSEHLVPSSPSTVDTTGTWTGSTPSDTIFTSNGTPYSEHLVPGTPSTVDTTSTWTGSTPSDTIFTSNGTPYSEHLVPGTPSTVDTTSTWTGTATSEIVFTSNGTPYSERLVPYQTITTPWTGTGTTTTLISNPTGLGSVFEVLAPYQSTTVTVLMPCTICKGATTYTKTNGCSVSVIIEDPKVTAVSTISTPITTIIVYKPCTGEEASAYTTTNGCTLDVIVETPGVTSLTTLSNSGNNEGGSSLLTKSGIEANTTIESIAEGSASGLGVCYWNFVYPLLLLVFIS